MFSTTLRIDENLGHFLQEAARRSALSVNAFLTDLIHREQEAAARKRLAHDWRAYAQDAQAQEVSYALEAQAQVVAEPKRKAYGAKRQDAGVPAGKPKTKPKGSAGKTK
ncbi:MAG: hypothetical protein KGN80_00680 [Acidobacteriota bacterium]|nr:hypothetical protein [Acidobacteriota bacterium]